jgi:hypothetical protein
MSIKRVFPMVIVLLAAGIFITACSPKTTAVQPASPQAEKPISPQAEQPAVKPTENPFNAANLGDCYNPFNPVMEGKVWKYVMVSGDVKNTMEISFKDVTQSSFTSVQKFSDISTEVKWTCSPDGLLSNQFGNLSIAQIPGIQFETVEVKGVGFPKEDKWQVGYAWNTEYVIKIKFTSGDTVYEGQGNIALKNTIAAIESVTVPAGTYKDVYKVNVTGNMTMNAMGTENTTPLTFINWYVRDVGMVKSSSADPNLSYSIELNSLE